MPIYWLSPFYRGWSYMFSTTVLELCICVCFLQGMIVYVLYDSTWIVYMCMLFTGDDPICSLRQYLDCVYVYAFYRGWSYMFSTTVLGLCICVCFLQGMILYVLYDSTWIVYMCMLFTGDDPICSLRQYLDCVYVYAFYRGWSYMFSTTVLGLCICVCFLQGMILYVLYDSTWIVYMCMHVSTTSSTKKITDIRTLDDKISCISDGFYLNAYITLYIKEDDIKVYF